MTRILNLIAALLAVSFLPLQCGFAKHIHYNWMVKYFCGSPDGVKVCHILGVNGQFPGPTIRASINDTLHITVRNHIQPGFGGTQTSIHWHGLFQKGSPFQDGVPSVTQCPIQRLNSQTYVFKLEQSGTYWWHSHVSYQYSEGMWGVLIIDNKPEAYADQYDDEIVITLNDWYHTSGLINTDWFLSAASNGNLPIPFSNLLNGRGRYPCNATRLPCSNNQPIQEFNVIRGKRYRIRIINTFTTTPFHFYIANHKLTVIEVDGVDTMKRIVNKVLPVEAAQRYSVIVEMNVVGNEHWIVAEANKNNFNYNEPNINPNPHDVFRAVRAKLVYGNGDANPNAQPYPPLLPEHPGLVFGFKDWEIRIQPLDGISAPKMFDQEIVLYVETLVDAKGVERATFNNITYQSGRKPLLGLVLKNRPIPAYANPFFTKFNQVVQIVVNNHGDAHPFHLHGHTFWVLGKGDNDMGDYNASRHELVLSGVRRDTEPMGKNTWMVLRFVTDNPGVWLFHCHFNWHLQGGLAATIIEAPEMARRELSIPSETKRICKSAGVKL